MIDRQVLKLEARQHMFGKKPSVFLVAVLYITLIGILTVLLSALSGYDKFAAYVEHVFPVNPYPTYDELKAALPPVLPMAGILFFAVLIVRLILDVGYMRYCLSLSRNEVSDFRILFDGFSLIIKIVALEIVRYVFIFLWSLLFIVPGVIAYYSYRQAFYILLDNPELGPLDCIRQSKQMMDGYKLELLFLDFSFIGWFILDLTIKIYTTLPLLSVFLAPYTGVTRAGFYNRLVAEEASVKEAG